MIIVLIIGLAIMLFGTIIKFLDSNAKDWPKTIGTITKSELRKKLTTDSDGVSRYVYKADFEYDFKVNGEENSRIGKQLFPYVEVWTSFRKEKMNIVKKLKKGTKVTVYYNPKNHSKSCLTVGANYFVNHFISGGFLFVIIAFVIWINEQSENVTYVLEKILVK